MLNNKRINDELKKLTSILSVEETRVVEVETPERFFYFVYYEEKGNYYIKNLVSSDDLEKEEVIMIDDKNINNDVDTFLENYVVNYIVKYNNLEFEYEILKQTI